MLSDKEQTALLEQDRAARAAEGAAAAERAVAAEERAAAAEARAAKVEEKAAALAAVAQAEWRLEVALAEAPEAEDAPEPLEELVATRQPAYPHSP